MDTNQGQVKICGALKVLGAENPADILTQYVDPKTLQSAFKRINMIVESGRPASAPKAAKV